LGAGAGAGFPYSGSGDVTGSIIISGSGNRPALEITGSVNVTGSITSSGFYTQATGTPYIVSPTSINLEAQAGTVNITSSPFRLASFTDVQTGINNLLGNKKGDPQSISANPTMSRYLTLQCETAEIPGKTLLTAEAKVYGPTYKVPYQTQYNDMSMTFLCTNEFYERKLFDKWIESIMPSDTNNLRFPKGESSRYLTNIKVLQYDNFIRQIYAVELMDAFPIGISSQPLSWAEEGFHRVTVQFAYQKYRVLYDGNYNLTEAALQIFGSNFQK
jgi:hypothetical protein